MKETKEDPECQKTEIWKRRTDNMEFLANTIIFFIEKRNEVIISRSVWQIFWGANEV